MRAHYAGAVTLRIRIDLSYDGTGFSGWAAQPGPTHGRGHAE